MLSTTAHRLLTEVGSTLPDRLLDELEVLVGGVGSSQFSVEEARVLVAQLQGWVQGLLPSVPFDSPEG